jgi:hypothetical protein
MSFKDDLDQRRKDKEDVETKNNEARQLRLEAREKRAQDLETHLEDKDVGSVGLKIAREDARITLKHDKFQILIDTDLDKYHVSKQVKNEKGPFHLMDTVSKRQVATLGEIDSFILDTVEGA